MPAGVLAKRCGVPARPNEASSERDETSTPQMMRVTVTFLVRAAEYGLATVRSCVTGLTVPGLASGEISPQNEREHGRPRGNRCLGSPTATVSNKNRR